MRNSSRTRQVKRNRHRDERRRLLVQPLEDRRVLALLGIAPSFPIVAANSTGTVQYEAATDTFTADALPLSIQESFFSFASAITGPATFDLQFHVDDTGAFSGGVVGDDFVLTGTADLDFDNVPDLSGTLLTGEVTAFGFADGSPTTTDSYDLRLTVTGGALAAPGLYSSTNSTRPAYFDGFDIGLLINSENSTFTGDFTVDFSGGNKATLGPIEPDITNPPTAELGNYVWYDNDYDGIQDADEPGVNGVTVNLYRDVDGDGVAEPGGDDGGPIATQVTSTFMGDDGYYLFQELEAGNYFVQFDTSTLPAGYQLTTQDAGSDDAVDSDADVVTGLTIVTNLVDNESDLTWDAGINLIVNPAIHIEKFVKVISGRTGGGEGLTPGFWKTHSEFGPAPLAGWPATGYSPLDSYNSVFGVSDDVGLTLLDALGRGGGGVNALGRHATAALLNAANPNVDYAYTQAEVISLTQTAYASGNPTLIEGTKNLFAVQNELGADLSTPADAPDSDLNDFGVDADTPPGPSAELGDTILFTYFVTNPGDVELTPVVVHDDNATPGVPGDDFNPDPVLEDDGSGNFFNVGDDDQDGRLDPGESWLYQAEIVALQAGQFTNIGTVVGTPVNENGDTIGADVTDDDPANYIVDVSAAIQIVKYVDKVVETQHQVCLDFDELSAGDLVSNQYPGVTISGKSNSRPTAGNAAMVFNSAAPTGGDYDLGTPNQAYGGPGQGSGGASNDTALGNILIISEDGDSADPDDDAYGGYIRFEFDSPVTIDHLDVLDIDSNEAGGSIITFTTTSGTQTISIPTAGNNSAQRIIVDVADVTEMKVKFVSSGAISELCYTESTEQKVWFDANQAPGVEFNIGETVEFSYHVTNPGDVELVPVVVVDDNATPGNTADDFSPTPVETVPGINDGDTDADGRLDPGEEWLYTAEIIATVAGQFTNIGKVTGTPVNSAGDVIADDVMDDDPANYVVNGTPGIDIEKLTNDVQADLPSEAVEIAAGDTVTWTYVVTNTGTTSFVESEVVVVDDAGTPGDTSDDFSPTLLSASDVGGDGVLSPGEQWTYVFSSTAEAVTTAGSTETVYLTGSSSLDGPDGNVRTYSAGGVTINASGYSRDGAGVWQDAFLGEYSSGLGVTDRSEGGGGNGQHRVDNIGRLNYVLFEFSEQVVVDAAFLDSVVGDSDLSIWIGNSSDLSSSGLPLSDAALSNLGYYETSMASNDLARWANFNASGVAGNVLVLAAWVDDATPEDCFKIRKIKFETIGQGVYGNIGTVTAGDVSDSDPSHYTNPAPAPSGVIGDKVWRDLDRDGKQDAGEPGVGGVTVNLLDAGGNQIATTTTNGDGLYEFTGLAAGDYRVKFELPNDHVFTRLRSDISDGIDSDANQTTGQSHLISLEDHQIDRSVDAGIYQAAVDVMFEAEHYEWLDHPWQVKCSSSASGGKYLVAPNGTGSYYNSPPYGRKVKYVFDVDSNGRYELSALLKAKSSKDNSVWFRVDGGGWKQWHTPVTGYDWQWHAATNGWDHDSVAFNLDAGQHTLELKVREDGTKFDKFMVSKLSTTTVVIDALDTTLNSSWQVDVDDDGNEFLVAVGGTHYHAPPTGGELTYDFTLAEGGTFEMHALVSAANGGDNSIWVQIDGGDWIEWHLTVTGDGVFTWQTVTDGWGQTEVDFDLAAGNHTLKLKVREDGTKIDKIIITDDQFIDLSGY